ncbi:MAG: PolC-type DNA polymerase III N-terminal domain-containing protein, partial [Lachnospiraceae bacterium]|nr:PolC-type DNA polymerase III N-terminal domain-containing protein [Lachnospiraceae bacterium]
MAKGFMEVFPGLKLSADIRDIFAQTEVERVSTTRNKDILKIYLESSRLIQKEQIYQAQQQI